ncbi:hypothetical protein EMCRGX_G022369 [Ephydatia muelleri]
MSNKLFREREADIAGPLSLIKPQLGAQIKAGEVTLESQLGIQSFNEKIERWFGSTQQFSNRVLRGWKICIVDCLAYPYTVFCRQCQVYPHYRVSPSPLAPLRSVIALHRIAHAQGIHACRHDAGSNVGSRRKGHNATQVRSEIPYPSKCVVCNHHASLVSYTYLEMVQNTSHRVHTSFMGVAFQRPLLMTGVSQQLPFSLLLGPTVLHSVACDAISYLVRRALNSARATLLPGDAHARRQHPVRNGSDLRQGNIQGFRGLHKGDMGGGGATGVLQGILGTAAAVHSAGTAVAGAVETGVDPGEEKWQAGVEKGEHANFCLCASWCMFSFCIHII